MSQSSPLQDMFILLGSKELELYQLRGELHKSQTEIATLKAAMLKISAQLDVYEKEKAAQKEGSKP